MNSSLQFDGKLSKLRLPRWLKMTDWRFNNYDKNYTKQKYELIITLSWWSESLSSVRLQCSSLLWTSYGGDFVTTPTLRSCWHLLIKSNPRDQNKSRCLHRRRHFINTSLLKTPDLFYMFLLGESMREHQWGPIAQVIKLILCWYILLISDSHHCWLWAVELTNTFSHLSIAHFVLVTLLLTLRLQAGPLVSLLGGHVTGPRGQTLDRGHQKMKFHFHQSRQSSKVCHGEWWRLAANK